MRPSLASIARWGALLTLFSGVACRCGSAPSEPPARYVSKVAEMVVEIPDVGGLVARRAGLLALMDGVASKGEIEEVEATLKHVLGFDPSTKEGLAAAGLPEHGPAAIEIGDSGRSMVWIVPVRDREKLKKVVDDLIKARAKIDATKEEKAGEATIVVHASSWGSDTYPVASYAFARGFVFLGLGRTGPDQIKAALARKPEESILQHPEYTALAKAIGDTPLARAIVPSAQAMSERLARAVGGAPNELTKALTSVGWALKLDGSASSIEGRFRFSDAGRAAIKKIAAVQGKPSAGVLAALNDEAALITELNVDLEALLALVAPPGSPEGTELDRELEQVKTEFGIDVRKQLLPQLTGHTGVAFGIGDLAALAGGMQALLQSPARVLWSTMAVGVRSSEEIKKLPPFSAEIDPILAGRGLAKSVRKSGEHEISVISLANPQAGQDPVMMESYLHDSAWVFGNSPLITDRTLKGELKGPADPLSGASGLFAELRVQPLVKAARSVDISRMGGGAEALLVRAMLGKILALLERIERVELKAHPDEDGAFAALTVTFAKPVAAASR